MANTTDIQWADSTVNPTMGCDGCELWGPKAKDCYAGKLHLMRGGRAGYAPTFEEVTAFPGRMKAAAAQDALTGLTRPMKPWLNGLPRLIFVSDMSDALSRAVSFEYLRSEIIETVSSPNGRRHRWLWLTKRPRRMAEFCRWLGRPWPWNLWAGTSITTEGTTERIEDLLEVGGGDTTRFLSVEPQRGPITLNRWLPKLNWIIQGGESGGKDAHAFHLQWAYDLKTKCEDAGVAYFLKQLGRNPLLEGKRLMLTSSHGGEWCEWPKDLRTRQVPKTDPPKPSGTNVDVIKIKNRGD